MGWHPLSSYVLDLWRWACRHPRQSGPVTREAAAALALGQYGEETLLAAPELVNIAALTLAMDGRPLNHVVRSSIGRMVEETDIHAVPTEPPRLLRRAWLVEAQRPERGEVLFGATASLGGYVLDGEVFVVGLDVPDGCRVARWRPQWSGEDLAAGVAREQAGRLVDDIEGHREWTREAVRFLVVLGLLFDAENAPLRSRDEVDGRGPRGGVASGGQTRPAAEWITRYVSLRPTPHAATEHAEAPHGTPDDRIASAVAVQGHLKRQRHGPGNARVKWIYVQGYEARRWIAPRPVRRVVG